MKRPMRRGGQKITSMIRSKIKNRCGDNLRFSGYCWNCLHSQKKAAEDWRTPRLWRVVCDLH
jgi:hypothetical protein